MRHWKWNVDPRWDDISYALCPYSESGVARLYSIPADPVAGMPEIKKCAVCWTDVDYYPDEHTPLTLEGVRQALMLALRARAMR